MFILMYFNVIFHIIYFTFLNWFNPFDFQLCINSYLFFLLSLAVKKKIILLVGFLA